MAQAAVLARTVVQLSSGILTFYPGDVVDSAAYSAADQVALQNALSQPPFSQVAPAVEFSPFGAAVTAAIAQIAVNRARGDTDSAQVLMLAAYVADHP